MLVYPVLVTDIKRFANNIKQSVLHNYIYVHKCAAVQLSTHSKRGIEDRGKEDLPLLLPHFLLNFVAKKRRYIATVIEQSQLQCVTV